MDFTLADDFIEHLELHPNGSFVLVKRDLPPPPQISLPPPPQPPPPAPPSPKIIINHHHRRPNNNNNDDDENYRKPNNTNNSSIDSRSCDASMKSNAEASEEDDEEEEAAPILPEMLKNQIKIEPISEDEEDEQTQREANHISNSSFNHNQDAPQYNNTNSNSADIQATADGSDPNQQLLVLSNPRIGDGPGEYLCNVCQAKFVYKNNLKSHLKRHLGIYP